MRLKFFVKVAFAVLIVSCGTKRNPVEKEKDEDVKQPPQVAPQPESAPSGVEVNQAKGATVAAVPETVKSQFSSSLTLVPSLNVKLGQAVSGTSIFEDLDKVILPNLCMDGTVNVNPIYGTLAMPHALVTDAPGSTYRGTTLDKAVVLKLFPNQPAKEISEFIAASEASTGRYTSSHIIHFKTDEFTLTKARSLQQKECGDRFVQKLTPTSFFFFTLKFEIADEAARTEFAALSFTGGADEIFSHARKEEVVAFLKAKSIPLQIVAIQGRNQLDEDIKQLIKDEQCGAYNIDACAKTYNRLKEYQQLAFKSQFKNAPKSLAELKNWGIYEFKTGDYKVHD